MKENYIDRNYIVVCRAIHILSGLFDNICTPIRNSYFYDLVVERDFNIYRVKVICTSCKAPSGSYVANIRRAGGNWKGKSINLAFDPRNCDFIYIDTPRHCYLISTDRVMTKRALTLSMFEDCIVFRE